MPIDFIYPEYEVIRNPQRCITCRVCERQCANEVHSYDAELNIMKSDESKCVNCHRCVSLCPTRALKIVKTDHTFKTNANWSNETIGEVYRQAGTGGMLLSSMGNPKPYPVYWDKILINASQVTNPSIDPLREPMETKTFLGKRPEFIERNPDGSIDTTNLPPNLELSVPIMFSAMGHKAENVGDAELVVYTAAVKADNPELIAAREKGIPVVERSVMLGMHSFIGCSSCIRFCGSARKRRGH